jgi:hypothetical protein
MNRASIAGRVDRLEQRAGTGDLPPYLRRWLGESLSAEDEARADLEWDQVLAQPQIDPATLPTDVRAWLADRGPTA